MHRHVKTACVVLATAAFGTFLPPAPPAHAEDEIKIAYVSLQRAIVEVDQGKRAKKELSAKIDKKKKEFEGEKEKLKQMRDALQKEAEAAEASVKNEAAIQAQMQDKLLEFERKKFEFQKAALEEEKKLKELEQKELQDITDKMRKLIGQMGKEGTWTLILELSEARLLYAKPHLDLTNELIRKYNALYK
jgi:outer membrane protein